jgi:muramoyltetrapeptide carboxypeptidase LdcA involved in peptidoglycan recycling
VTAPILTVPRKLHRGDTIRVVAPARSRQFVAEHDHSGVIDARFAALGLRLTFADHVDERDDFESSPVASRVSDLHAAFAGQHTARSRWPGVPLPARADQVRSCRVRPARAR